MPMKAPASTNRRIPSPQRPDFVQESNRMIHKKRPGKAKVYAVASRPGGKGKTTTSSGLAGYLALRGYATLLVEFDDHARVYIRLIGTQKRNAPPLDLSRTSYALFEPERFKIQGASFQINMSEAFGRSGLNRATIENVCTERGWQEAATLDVIPGTPSLRNIDGLYAVKEREAPQKMQQFIPNIQAAKSLDYFRDLYDAIVIDTSASLTTLTWNALMAANHVYMPVGFSPDSIEDFDETNRTFEQVLSMCESLDRPAPTLDGYLGNFFNRDQALDRAIFNSYIGPHADPDQGGIMVPAAIPYPMLGCIPLDASTLNNAMALHMTVHTYAPQSEIGKAMYDFCRNTAKAGGLE